MEPGTPPDSLETRSDLLPGDEGLWQYWDIQETVAEREERSWRHKGRAILKRYRDERSPQRQKFHQFNILWSNVQILKPALYGRMPVPDCERRFKDQDDVGRLASEILERTLKYNADMFGLDDALKASVEDLLLPGRGVLRVLYVPHFEKPGEGADPDDDGAPENVANEGDEAPGTPSAPGQAPGETGSANEGGEASGAQPEEAEEEQSEDPQEPEPRREVIWEEVHFRTVNWEDYAEGPARQWNEVPWVRYRAFMTRDELKARFGAAKANATNLDYVPKGVLHEDTPDAPPDAFKKCVVYETWDRWKKEVVWWAPGTPGLVFDTMNDPLKLRNFFPSPDPLLATTTTDKRIPVPDYHEYQDQAEELDVLSARIERLQRALKVFGIYPGEEKQILSKLMSDDAENLLIPVEDWQPVVDKGGMEGMIQWFPVKEIAEALIQLYACRDKAKEVLYEITGIADIIRGATAPQETATAQQLKSQFSTLRLSDRQKMVARMSADVIRLAAEVIGEQFSARTISLMSGYPQLVPLPLAPSAPPMPPDLQAALAQLHAQQAPAAGATGTTTMLGQNNAAPMGTPPPQPPQPQLAPEMLQKAQAFQQQMQLYQAQLQQYQGAVQENQQRERQFEAAIALIKEDALNNFRIDIEADSTIAVDEQAEKQARTEFLEQMVPLLEQVIPLSQGVPPIAALAKEIVLFAARSFKAGRPLEEALEQAFDAISKMPPNPKAQGMDGKHGAQQANPAGDIAMAQAHQHDADVTAQADMHGDKLKAMVQMQTNAIKQQQVQGQFALERERLHLDTLDAAVTHALNREKAVSQERLQNARQLATEARGATGLV